MFADMLPDMIANIPFELVLPPLAAAAAVATACGAISLSRCPPMVVLNATPAGDLLREHGHRRDWRSLLVVVPSPGDLVVAFWALFWRLPTRALARIVGYLLLGIVPDASDLWLSTEL
ncbi:hypothetical protein Hte_008049 [Hypoxylon texense]